MLPVQRCARRKRIRSGREPLDPQRPVGGDADTGKDARTRAGIELPPTSRARPTLASWLTRLARTLQVALLIHLRQLPQTLLQLLPGSYSSPRRFLRPFRHVVARGLPLLSVIADIEVRTMLGSALVAMAARLSTRAIGFRQGSEKPPPGPDARSRSAASAVGRKFQPLAACSLLLCSFLALQRASENRFLVITDQPT